MLSLLLMCRLCPPIFSSTYLHVCCSLGSFEDRDQEYNKTNNFLQIILLQEKLVKVREILMYSLNYYFYGQMFSCKEERCIFLDL